MVKLPKIPSTNTLFTPQDVAGYLGVSNQRVYQLIQEGKIPEPAGHVGKRRAFTPDQLSDILAKRPPKVEKGERWITFSPEDPKRGSR